MSGSASLGQLAVRAGLLPEADRVRLCAVVAERATSPQPVSLGRLLLKGGMRGGRLCTLLASGVSLDEVLCDGCGAGTAQGRLTSRDEFACRDCGALFFGFAAFASRRLRAVAPTAVSTGADLGRTVEFGGVLPLPGVTLAMSGSDPVRTTVGYGVVLNPTPPGESDGYVFPGAVGRRSESEARSELAWIQAGLESLADETGAVRIGLNAPPEPPRLEDCGDDLPYESVGGFRLLSRLGVGGMGSVYLAEEPDTNDPVALKVVRVDEVRGTSLLERFKREAEALTRLDHPNIVQVFDSGFDEALQVQFLALEYLEGGSLLDLLAGNPMMDEREALTIVRGVCLALEAARLAGIVHRDIKPGNILIDVDGGPKLADLGLAKDLESAVRLTATGMIMGTPAYMSPEQALSERDIDIRADIYGLGGCFYEMLTGRVPFVAPGRDLIEIVRKRLTDDLPDVRLIRESLSGATANIVRCMTRRLPADRYATPAEVVNDIDRALAGDLSVGAPNGTGPTPPGGQAETETVADTPQSVAEGPPRWLWVLTAVLLLGLAAVVYAVLR